MAQAAKDFRKFNERPFSRKGQREIHSESMAGNEGDPAAPLSNSDETPRSHGRGG
jgi:hypothetical protein